MNEKRNINSVKFNFAKTIFYTKYHNTYGKMKEMEREREKEPQWFYYRSQIMYESRETIR